jgi:hypothetical protein
MMKTWEKETENADRKASLKRYTVYEQRPEWVRRPLCSSWQESIKIK